MPDAKEQEEQSFLQDAERDSTPDCEKQEWRTHSSPQTKKWKNFYYLQLALLCVNLVILALNIFGFTKPSIRNSQEAWSPVTSKVPFMLQRFDQRYKHSSPYIGEPRPELDQAWSELIKPGHIRISPDEMRRMNKTSLALRDGSGYLGYLEVKHNLHCLKRFKQFRHLDHYSDLDPEGFTMPHWDHCIEVIRKSLMCNADLSIDTVDWHGGHEKKHLVGISNHPKICKDWKSITDWEKSRGVYLPKVMEETALLIPGEEGYKGP